VKQTLPVLVQLWATGCQARIETKADLKLEILSDCRTAEFDSSNFPTLLIEKMMGMRIQLQLTKSSPYSLLHKHVDY
jgi:hypothetical protein